MLILTCSYVGCDSNFLAILPPKTVVLAGEECRYIYHYQILNLWNSNSKLDVEELRRYVEKTSKIEEAIAY